MQTFVLGSTDRSLILALARACSSLEIEARIIPTDVPKGYYATPIGFYNIADYAQHTANAANSEITAPHTLAIGIQNGLVRKLGDRWYAVDAINAMEAGGSTLESWWTELVPVPEPIVKLVRRRGVTTATVGRVAAEIFSCPPDDPYRSFGANVRSREELVEEALEKVFQRLLQRGFIKAEPRQSVRVSRVRAMLGRLFKPKRRNR